MVVTAIRTQYKLSMPGYPDRSSSSKFRSASLDRCKTWTLDRTHELTDIWTPDKAINDDMTHMPCIQPCPSSVQCTSQWTEWRIWRLSKIVAVCTVH